MLITSHKSNNMKEILEKKIGKLSELDNLRQYCNCQFGKISTSYNCIVINIDDSWSILKKKYKLNEIKAD